MSRAVSMRELKIARGAFSTIGERFADHDAKIAPFTAGLGTALPATTGAVSVTMDSGVKTLTPTGAITLNATGGVVGQTCDFVITTSGTTTYNVTFGTNFKSTGVLATGAVTAKVFVLAFIYDGTNWNEVSRTVAM